MELIVNGQHYTHEGDGSLAALIGEVGADAERVACVVNDEVITRDMRASVALHAGDRVEILSFAGGG